MISPRKRFANSMDNFVLPVAVEPRITINGNFRSISTAIIFYHRSIVHVCYEIVHRLHVNDVNSNTSQCWMRLVLTVRVLFTVSRVGVWRMCFSPHSRMIVYCWYERCVLLSCIVDCAFVRFSLVSVDLNFPLNFSFCRKRWTQIGRTSWSDIISWRYGTEEEHILYCKFSSISEFEKKKQTNKNE